MAKITTSNLDSTINTKLAAGESANAAVANIVSLAISSVQIADSSYNVIDDTAANTGGGYLVINGTGFTNQSVVIVGTTNATSTTFANTKQLRAQVPGLAAASYPLYVVDSVTGATAIKVNGVTYSPFPAWSTDASLANTTTNTAFSVSLSANSDSNIIYANTTALPAGTTLAANGLFSGTVSVGSATTYSFDVRATDVENQDASRTFSLTVLVPPARRLWRTGRNLYGQLGSNNTNDISSFTQLTDVDWEMISMGYWVSLAIKQNGTLWALGGWGNVAIAGNYVDRSSPVQIGTNTNWLRVSVGREHALAVKTDGTLWAWGSNTNGACGDPVGGGNSPKQVGTNTNWNLISAGVNTSLATKTDGTLWSWGSNNQGALGLNLTSSNVTPSNTQHRSSPVQVGTNTNWSKIANGTSGLPAGMATKTDGTLWTWGVNNTGQLGLNDRTYRSSPTQVGSATNWNNIDTNSTTSLATKTDGTLWTWGRGAGGELGINNTHSSVYYRSSPGQVGGSTDWNLVSIGSYSAPHTVGAIKTNGTLWMWGRGAGGELGLGNAVDRSSPTQVGTATNWVQLSIGGGSSWAIAQD